MPRNSFSRLPASEWAPQPQGRGSSGRSSSSSSSGSAKGRTASVTIAPGVPAGKRSDAIGEDSSFSLYIPRIQHHVPERMLRAVLRQLGLGKMGSVRMIPRTGFQSAVVEFEHPFVRGQGHKARANRDLLDAIAAGHVLTVVFDDHTRPWRARRWHDNDRVPKAAPPPLQLQPGVLPHPSYFQAPGQPAQADAQMELDSPTYTPYDSPTYSPPKSPTYSPQTPPPKEVDPDLAADCAVLIAAACESLEALALQSAHIAGDGVDAEMADAVGEAAYEAHSDASDPNLHTLAISAAEQAECEVSLAELAIAMSGGGNIACDEPVHSTDLFAFQPATFACPTAITGW
jgi:hypothetical protein